MLSALFMLNVLYLNYDAKCDVYVVIVTALDLYLGFDLRCE
jgi:hypothetical protein